MVVSSDKIIAFRFLSSQKFGQSSRDLQMIRYARLPALARGRCLWAQLGRRCCQRWLACLTSARTRGRRPGRAEITGSREGAKPRSSDEKRTIFRQSPRAASVESFLGKGHPGTMAPSARRARMNAHVRGAGGRSGLRVRKSRAGGNSFSGAGFWLRWHFVITIC